MLLKIWILFLFGFVIQPHLSGFAKGFLFQVFQRRVNGNVDFFRGWNDYENGFGNKDGDFWLGLAALHQMTKGGNMEMEIKMITRHGAHWADKYSNFRIGPGSDKYRLHVSGYSGNSPRNGLAHSNNHQFSTKDADHDGSSADCASYHEAGWWYWSCAHSNPNGNFRKTGDKGFWWGGSFSYSSYLSFSEMKIRKRA